MSAWLKKRLQDLAIFIARTLDGFLQWLFKSRNPAVVLVRETIRRNPVLISGARKFIRTVRRLPTLKLHIRERFKPKTVRRLQSVMAARAVGGSVTASEFERIWGGANGSAWVLVIAEGPEREQIEVILDANAARATFCSSRHAFEVATRDISGFDLVIAAPVPGLAQQIAELESRAPNPKRFIRVGETARRSDYFAPKPAAAATDEESEGGRRSVPERIANGQPLRVVVMNDVGFQYGAGVAVKRQVASLLLKGWEVSVVACFPGTLVDPPAVTGVKRFQGWQGMHSVSEDHRRKSEDRNQSIADVFLSTIRKIDPDVVITGNLHGTGIPLELAQGLKTTGKLVVSYMHDCFWATGRCAYPTTCQLYRSGCDETCPTPDEYPKLAPEKIAPAWRTKADIFTGATGIPLVTNSGWTRDIVVQRYGDRARVDCVPLAVDHELFAPIPKAVARRLLGLPVEGTFVVMGAVDILNKWKGGNLFREIHDRLEARRDLSLLLFGQSSDLLRSKRSFGLVADERLLPLILGSADIFVGTATEEAFGQTLLEASACGIPVVAFDRGGVSDIVVDGETGILVQNLNAGELYNAINRLLADPSLRELLGRNARKRVEAHFTLTKQGDAWIDHLRKLSDLRHR
jgi:glycosyltransferase involved in cell wall biosynthesis